MFLRVNDETLWFEEIISCAQGSFEGQNKLLESS
jgi:hypothetical protein